MKPSFPSFPSVTLFLLLIVGCSVPRPQRGGKAVTALTPAGAITQALVQSDNPSAPSRQTQETIRTRTYTLPEPATFNLQPSTPPQPAPSNFQPSTSRQPATSGWSRGPWSRSPLQVTEREESRSATELGAAQKDTARELSAKLSSLKSITWAGVVVFLFGLISLWWPPLQGVIGSVTTSAAITAGGLALIILPTLIVGHELLILGGVAVVIAAWFLAHRHGHLRGQLAKRPKL